MTRIIIYVSLFFALVGTISYVFGWFSDAGETVKKEYSASAVLKKYEWFKDASAQLDKKMSDIKVYEQRMLNLEEDYKGVTRRDWAREDREQYNVWSSEIAGVKASYNQLAAEYNAAMAKFNYSFANRGELPAGATDPLPREYKPYLEQ